MSTAFINATIWTAAGPAIERGTLVIDGDKIAAVGTDIDPGDAEIVDRAGKVITPGFIDCHSHVGIFGEGTNNDWDGIYEDTGPYVP